jgi:hypothetical protein
MHPEVGLPGAHERRRAISPAGQKSRASQTTASRSPPRSRTPGGRSGWRRCAEDGHASPGGRSRDLLPPSSTTSITAAWAIIEPNRRISRSAAASSRHARTSGSPQSQLKLWAGGTTSRRRTARRTIGVGTGSSGRPMGTPTGWSSRPEGGEIEKSAAGLNRGPSTAGPPPRSAMRGQQRLRAECTSSVPNSPKSLEQTIGAGARSARAWPSALDPRPSLIVHQRHPLGGAAYGMWRSIPCALPYAVFAFSHDTLPDALLRLGSTRGRTRGTGARAPAVRRPDVGTVPTSAPARNEACPAGPLWRGTNPRARRAMAVMASGRAAPAGQLIPSRCPGLARMKTALQRQRSAVNGAVPAGRPAGTGKARSGFRPPHAAPRSPSIRLASHAGSGASGR